MSDIDYWIGRENKLLPGKFVPNSGKILEIFGEPFRKILQNVKIL